MANLKKLTWEHHKNAERQAFVKEMFSGNISNERYATYLYNQFPQYNLLEAIAFSHGIFDDVPEMRRAPLIFEDFQELWPDKDTAPPLVPVVEEYIQYLKPLIPDKDRITAHVYVRHLGDLSGGQLIAARVPGSCRMYKFDRNIEDLKNTFKEKLSDDMAEEAKICFEFATKMFKQLAEIQK